MLLPIKLAVAIIGSGTIYNSVETILGNRKGVSLSNSSSTILDQYLHSKPEFTCSNDNISDDSSDSVNKIVAPHGRSKDDVLKDLKSMKRKELLTLFRYCDTPDDLRVLEGEWDGVLLNNNYVMTSVSKFMIFLFGRFEAWNGKEFGLSPPPDESKSTNSSLKKQYVGVNRFIQKKKAIIRKTHNFDYSITSSILGRSSIQLKYSPYQGNLSLWKTMVDELRIIEIPKVEKDSDSSNDQGVERSDYILLGMGSMGWSGGMYNCQPFCLYKS